MKTLKGIFFLLAICVMLVFLWPLIREGSSGFMVGFEHGLNPAASATPAPRPGTLEAYNNVDMLMIPSATPAPRHKPRK